MVKKRNGMGFLLFFCLWSLVSSTVVRQELENSETTVKESATEYSLIDSFGPIIKPFLHERKDRNCTKDVYGTEKNSSSEFPPDLFTDDERDHGAVILHFIAALYCFGMIGILCGDYFLPSVDCVCCDLNLSQDVAAATFMSFATSAPEFFVILIGTFITGTDIGLGAVVGSGMFNVLGVATCGGLAAREAIKLEWWPLYRDSVIYVLALIALITVIWDEKVVLGEAIFLFVCYIFYFVLMYYNTTLKKLVKKCIKKIRRRPPALPPKISVSTITSVPAIFTTGPDDFNNEQEEEEVAENYVPRFINNSRRQSRRSNCSEYSCRSSKRSIQSNLRRFTETLYQEKEPEETETTDEEFTGKNLLQLPEGSVWDSIIHMVMLPATAIFYITIPDCRVDKYRKYYPFTFLMCVFWIGVTSYLGTWMISVLGDTIGIPDSVMGLTFLAAGGSMPEAISTVILARSGEGGIGFSNSLGGNTMDICLCLSVPWLIKCALDYGTGYVQVESQGLQYNCVALFIGVFVLLVVATLTKFHMNKKMGIVCFLCYIVFIVMSILIEVGIIIDLGC